MIGNAGRIVAERSIGDLATEIPGAARVFERTGIDFCCGGHQSLSAACQKLGLDVDKIITALESSQAKPELTDEHWRTEPIAVLLDYVVDRHHAYARAEIPHIRLALDDAVAAHFEHHPELMAVRHSFTALGGELTYHMSKQELVLFPAFARLAQPGPAAGRMQLAREILLAALENEHAGRDLAEIRRNSGDLTPPPDAGIAYRELYRLLAEFEADVHRHLHLENNILFPRLKMLLQFETVAA